MPASFTSSSNKFKNPLVAWALVLLFLIMAELALHTDLKNLVPQQSRWGNARIDETLNAYDEAVAAGGVDLLILGSSQGKTWINPQVLFERFNLRAVNASIPGANMEVSTLLAEKVMLPRALPKKILITVGPMMLSHWNEHFKSVIFSSRSGRQLVDPSPLGLFFEENVALVRYGGQQINSQLVQSFLKILRGGTSKATFDPIIAQTKPEASRQLEGLRALQFSQVQLDAFQRFVELGRSRRIPMYIADMPLHEEALKNRLWSQEEYRAVLLESAKNLPLIDLSPLKSPELFSDFAHSSVEGTKQATQLVGEYFRSAVAQQ